MPDRRKHRGPHPEDVHLFASKAVPALAQATSELGWLLSRDYPIKAALELVGNRHGLTERQRIAVQRASCSDAQLLDRAARQVPRRELLDADVWIDGFNVVTTVEAALSGGVLLACRDGALRDMASMHGSYRKVAETPRALHAIADVLTAHRVARCRWFLDQPVSNSGRLKTIIADIAAERQLVWSVDVVSNPDRNLIDADESVVIASADSQVLDGATRTWHLALDTVGSLDAEVRVVDLSL